MVSVMPEYWMIEIFGTKVDGMIPFCLESLKWLSLILLSVVRVPVLYDVTAKWHESVCTNIKQGFGVIKKKFKLFKPNYLFTLLTIFLCHPNLHLLTQCNGKLSYWKQKDINDGTMNKLDEMHDDTQDDPHEEIIAEDNIFTQNQDKLNTDSDTIDLDVLKNKNQQHFWDTD